MDYLYYRDVFATRLAYRNHRRSFVAVLQEEALRRLGSYPLRKRYETGSCHYLYVCLKNIPNIFELCWWYVTTVGMEPGLVIPTNPGSSFKFHLGSCSHRAVLSDDFGFVKSIYTLSQGIIVTITLRTYGIYNSSFSQSLCVSDGKILDSTI